MELKIYKEKPDFCLFSYKLKQQGVEQEKINNSLKKTVIVEFPNCISTTTNKPFKWLPTYKQLDDIKKALEEIEKESWNK